MASLSGIGLVLVEFEYEYKGRDGALVSIKPNERYVLLAKTNDHWWHVRKNEHNKPFYIPAKYVKELPSNFPSPLDYAAPPSPELKPVQDLAKDKRSDEVKIRVRSPANYRKTENRMSTFGVPMDFHEPPPFKRGELVDSVITMHASGAQDPTAKMKRLSLAPNMLFGASHPAGPVLIDDQSYKPRVPSFSPADPLPRQPQGKPVDFPLVKDISKVGPKPVDLPKSVVPLEPEEGSGSSLDTDHSPDVENIYESIIDLKLDMNETTPASASAPAPAPIPSAVTPQTAKAENESPNTAVYANVTELKKASAASPPSSSSHSLSGASQPPPPDPEGWEVHTDKNSGKEYFFQPSTGHSTWDNPRSSAPTSNMESMASPQTPSSPASSKGSDWEQLMDETTGRHYYYNSISGQTIWASSGSGSPRSPLSPSAESHARQKHNEDGPPPLPEEDYPTTEKEEPRSPVLRRDLSLPLMKYSGIPRVTLEPNVPTGWTRSHQTDGKMVFTNECTNEQWIQSKDEKGKTYYYLKDGSRSQWTLPELPASSGQSALGNGVEMEGTPVLKNWRYTMVPEDPRFFPTHRRHVSDYTSEVSSSGTSPEMSHQCHQLEKAGILNKTKVSDNGKKLRKNWSQSWTVLHDGILTFHKDPKFAPSGPSNKSNQIIPEFTVELRGATLARASKDKSSKKNVLELKTRHGSEYLIQYDTDSIITDWEKIILDTIKQIDHDHLSEDEEDDMDSDKDKKKPASRAPSNAAIADPDQGVRNKLRKFLQRRPTLQSVKDKGYIKDAVFGCHLDTLCHRENTTVPQFVEKCIRAVERRGLDIDGIYRVSGNLAVIQKLRHKADHEEDLDLDDGQWEEIHVITGALKLFLREMPEPLFPYSFFDKFIATIKISDHHQKVSYMQDLVRSLPLPNHNTMEALFKHLRKVIDHGEANRMSVQSTAIVFGPTLLRPETESGNITMHMVFQNQIVELILHEFNTIFRPT
uniref:Rho GTPase-activating protein 27-like n=1 Tax=Denticeps clupeoides TaxID=299321 RepID=A0AAY4DZH3_9TELE